MDSGDDCHRVTDIRSLARIQSGLGYVGRALPK